MTPPAGPVIDRVARRLSPARWLARWTPREERWCPGNRVRLLRDGAEAYPAMLEAIAAAERQVLLEMYWFGSDATGRRFAAALAAAATRGCEVAVSYDAWGSFEADRAMFEELAAMGVQVHEFNPVAPWRRRVGLPHLSRRDHRKLLVVDGRLAFTGGINLGDPWAPPPEGEGWRDDFVAVEGPAAAELATLFAENWRHCDGRPLTAPTAAAPHPAANGSDGVPVRVLGEAYWRNQRETFLAYLRRIRAARRSVWIRNSYFVPDRRVLRAIEAAARRGVDVRVLVPGRSDVAVVKYATRAMYGRLLRAGVQVLEWHDTVLHAKSAVIDGTWSTIGTFNLDHLSLRVNLEVNVAIDDAAFGSAVERSFEADFERAVPVDAVAHFYRSLGARLLEAIAYRLRRFL